MVTGQDPLLMCSLHHLLQLYWMCPCGEASSLWIQQVSCVLHAGGMVREGKCAHWSVAPGLLSPRQVSSYFPDLDD